MKKLFVVLVLLFVAFVAINRQRLFLRDPLATVYRNSVPVKEARVYINYSNDILVEEPTEGRRWIVQNWNKAPGTPTAVTCWYSMACRTDADQASATPLGSVGNQPPAQMSAREVSFNDGSGSGVRVTLR